jgi:hypothetical protein
MEGPEIINHASAIGDFLSYTNKPEYTELPTTATPSPVKHTNSSCTSPCTNRFCAHLLAQQCKVSELRDLRVSCEQQSEFRPLLVQDVQGLTPLHYVLSRTTDTSKFVDGESKEYNNTKNPIVETVKELSFPGFTNFISGNEKSVFHYAAERGHWQALGYLLIQDDSSKNVNLSDLEGKTPLFYAIESVSSTKRMSRMIPEDIINTVRVLLALGADPTIQDNLGNTAIHVLMRNSSMEAGKKLMEEKLPAESIKSRINTVPNLILRAVFNSVLHSDDMVRRHKISILETNDGLRRLRKLLTISNVEGESMLIYTTNGFSFNNLTPHKTVNEYAGLIKSLAWSTANRESFDVGPQQVLNPVISKVQSLSTSQKLKVSILSPIICLIYASIVNISFNSWSIKWAFTLILGSVSIMFPSLYSKQNNIITKTSTFSLNLMILVFGTYINIASIPWMFSKSYFYPAIPIVLSVFFWKYLVELLISDPGLIPRYHNTNPHDLQHRKKKFTQFFH